MAAYVIVHGNITDPVKYDAYKQLSPAAVRKYGGRFLARGGTREDLEGRWEVDRVVIIEFDSMDRARTWYHSSEYQAARAIREGAADMAFTLVEGVG
jgi:uncharacterized protein (DUF1330 family)